MQLPEKIRSWVGRPVGYVSSEWNRLAPRERRLVAGLVGTVALFAVLVVGFLLVGSLRDLAESNEDTREALSAIAKHRTEYQEAKDRMMAQEIRIGAEAPQFAADLEAAAREVGIQIPETNEQPTAPAGRRYLEHRVDVKLREVDLLSLSRFLSKLENSRRLIIVSQLRIRRRFAEAEKLDVELTCTGYERVKETTKRKGTLAPKGDRT